MTVTVPANLLLFGEYAVLEEGGLGLAVAIEARARATFTPAARTPDASLAPDDPHANGRPRIVGSTPAGEIRWPGDTGVLGGVASFLARRLGPVDGAIGVDTAAFFTEDGRKRGFGSSAALSVAVAALWLAATDPRDRPAEGHVAELATAAHRAAQNGRGSGYDTWTSSLGGAVLFRGGRNPRAERVSLPWLPAIELFAGVAPVATTGAVGRYEAWKAHDPAGAAAFLASSNRLVRAIATSASWEEARPSVIACRELGLSLGDRIGVPASIEGPSELETTDVVTKAIGAGNELGVALVPPERKRSGGVAVPVLVAPEGVTWA